MGLDGALAEERVQLTVHDDGHPGPNSSRTGSGYGLMGMAERATVLGGTLEAGTNVAVSGILEPAYSICGDSFDDAVNPGQLDMTIIDAIGHGLPAVLMASAAINTLRNARRERMTLEQTYGQTDRRIAEQFGHSFYVTGQIASLDTDNGQLSWLNAGHVLPLLVRNDSFVGELACRPSMPIGLGGPVVEIAVEQLQNGDRVLFHTDGVIESRSPDGTLFGVRPAGRLSGSGHPRPGLGRRDRAPALRQRRCPRRSRPTRRRNPVPRRIPQRTVTPPEHSRPEPVVAR